MLQIWSVQLKGPARKTDPYFSFSSRINGWLMLWLIGARMPFSEIVPFRTCKTAVWYATSVSPRARNIYIGYWDSVQCSRQSKMDSLKERLLCHWKAHSNHKWYRLVQRWKTCLLHKVYRPALPLRYNHQIRWERRIRKGWKLWCLYCRLCSRSQTCAGGTGCQVLGAGLLEQCKSMKIILTTRSRSPSL